MKHLILTIVIAFGLTSFSGCGFLQKAYQASTTTLTAQTSDQIVIRSEQLTRQALFTFDTFLFIERNNETQLKAFNPQIHVVAEKIRAHGQEWLKAARRTTQAFKDSRTRENEANMRTAYTTLLQAYNEVKTAKSQADTLSQKSP